MKSYWLGIVSAVLMTSVLRAENTLFPSCGLSGSIAPYVDKDGYINPIIPLGVVDFGEGLTLPLSLNYSSKVRPPSREFGQGWECPLFESKIFDVQKDLKKVELMGGRQIYLVYNQRTDTWKHYFSDAWKGEAKGDEFELTYQTGCKFTFNKGLISSLTMPDGRTILWNRSSDGKLISMSESGKSPALQIAYDQLGFAKQLLFNPDSMGVARKTYDLEPSLVYAGIDKITCPGGRTVTLDRTRDKLLNPVLSMIDTIQRPMTMSWDLKTGKIISDDKYTYQITDVADDKTYPKMARINKTTKKMETYFYDEKHGVTDVTLPDGTLRHTEIIQSPGANYRATRLIQETKNGKTQVVLRRSFDDTGHLLLEAMGLANGKEQVKAFTYNDVGQVLSYSLNGKEVWRNEYDAATGQLTERVFATLGVKLAFEPLSGGEVKESLEKIGGSVTSVKTLAPQDFQNTALTLQRLE